MSLFIGQECAIKKISFEWLEFKWSLLFIELNFWFDDCGVAAATTSNERLIESTIAYWAIQYASNLWMTIIYNEYIIRYRSIGLMKQTKNQKKETTKQVQ